MKRSGVCTHPCWSPTPMVNDLTLPTRTQTFDQKYSDLTVSNRRSSTPYSRNTPQSFSRGTQLHPALSRSTSRCVPLSRSTKHVYTFLAYSQDFSKICWRVKIRSVVLRPERKPHWVSCSFDSIIS